MAQENIVSGLFGLSPWQVSQQRMAQGDQSAAAYAQLDPFQKASYGLQRGAGMLAGAGAEAMGMVDPAVQEAQQRQTALQGLDVSSPESIMQRAMQIQDPRLKTQLVMLAQQRQAEIDKSKLVQAQTDKALRPPSTGGGLSADIQGWMIDKQQNGYKGSLQDWIRGKKEVKSGGGEKPANNLLQKDQRWVMKDGEWVAEVIPGSRTFLAQKNLYAADKSTMDVLESSSKASADKIDFMLKPENKDAFNNLFGGYNAKYATQYMSGKTADVKQKLESLKSEMKAAGLQIMRSGGGVGQITEREWKIMENMIDSLDPTMSENAARTVLQDISSRMNAVANQGRQKFNTEWTGSQFMQEKPASSGVKFLGFE